MEINLLKELRKVLKYANREFSVKLIISILLRGLLLIIPVLFSQAINFATKGEYNSAFIFIGVSAIVAILYRLSEGFNQKALYYLYNKIYSSLNALGIQKTNENSIFSLSRFNLGQYSNILTTDVDIISAFFANGVIRVVQLFEFFVIYAYFWSLDIVLFAGALLVSIIVLLMIPKANKKVEEYNANKKLELDKLTGSIHEYFGNIKDIKCFNIYDAISPRVKNQTKKYLKENSKYFVRYTWNNQIFLMIIEIFRLLSVAYGIHLITQGSLEIGSLLIIYNYYQKIIDNFATILTMSVEYTNLKVSLGRFNHLVEYSSPKLLASNNQSFITEGKIVFKDILYGYRNNPTLKNVSFEIEPNTLTAITGKAGTGKTGIFDLLLKLNRQHQGEITIDGIDIRKIPDEEYFSKITSLNKNPSLFTMSIKDNFRLVEKDENKIYEICNYLGIHGEIIKLKNGYDTILEQNDGISETLKQQIAVARTILKGSKIMLFDEAFIGLDNFEQNRIIRLLLQLKNDHTIIMITHDKNVLKDAEKIIVMDNKTVVESGTLKELIDKKGKYYELYESGT